MRRSSGAELPEPCSVERHKLAESTMMMTVTRMCNGTIGDGQVLCTVQNFSIHCEQGVMIHEVGMGLSCEGRDGRWLLHLQVCSKGERGAETRAHYSVDVGLDTCQSVVPSLLCTGLARDPLM